LLVCHCKGLTDRAVRRTVNDGACSVTEVTRTCGAGGICGGCRPAIQEIVDESRASYASRSAHAALEGLELSAAR
jgi:bacterioferritin-associated ferredoxin